jgi:hypothetical protein
MRSTIRSIIATTTVTFLAGCAVEATPIPFDEAKPVPSERVYLYQVPEGAATNSVEIKRDVGLPSAMCAANLLVNGKLAATLETGEKVTLYLPAGRAFLGATPRSCGSHLSEAQVNVVPGQAQRFRITASSSGEISITPTATE